MEKRALGADLVIPLMALAFTLYFLSTIRGMEWEAKANGVIVGVMLIALVLAQIARIAVAVARGRATLGFEPLLAPRTVLAKRVGMLAICVAFVAALPYTGLAIGLYVSLAAGFALMGVRGPARVLLIALAVTVVVEALFVVALQSGLPKGPVEQAIARLRG